MADLKVTLQRQVGPFKLWQWIIVGIVGIGLGLLIRRRMASKPGKGTGVVGNYDGTSAASNDDGAGASLGATQGSIGQEGQLIDWGSAAFIAQENNRWLDELDNEMNSIFAPILDRLEKVTVPVQVVQPSYSLPTPIFRAPETVPVSPTVPTPATQPTSLSYTVVKGDTLTKIGKRFGMPWQTIYEANRGVIGANPDLIRPGQVYRIPK